MSIFQLQMRVTGTTIHAAIRIGTIIRYTPDGGRLVKWDKKANIPSVVAEYDRYGKRTQVHIDEYIPYCIRQIHQPLCVGDAVLYAPHPISYGIVTEVLESSIKLSWHDRTTGKQIRFPAPNTNFYLLNENGESPELVLIEQPKFFVGDLVSVSDRYSVIDYIDYAAYAPIHVAYRQPANVPGNGGNYALDGVNYALNSIGGYSPVNTPMVLVSRGSSTTQPIESQQENNMIMLTPDVTLVDVNVNIKPTMATIITQLTTNPTLIACLCCSADKVNPTLDRYYRVVDGAIQMWDVLAHEWSVSIAFNTAEFEQVPIKFYRVGEWYDSTGPHGVLAWVWNGDRASTEARVDFIIYHEADSYGPFNTKLECFENAEPLTEQEIIQYFIKK